MGSNKTTRKTKEPVVKGVGGGGSWTGNDSETKDRCAISLEFNYQISDGQQIKSGDKASLITSSNGQELDLIVNLMNIGEYHNKNEQLLKDCMKKGFVYAGEVTKVLGNSTIAIKLKGNG